MNTICTCPFRFGAPYHDTDCPALTLQTLTTTTTATHAAPEVPEGGTGGEGLWLIWSNEHGAFWRPNGAGYTGQMANAGRYTEEEAKRNCNMRSKTVQQPEPEVMIPAPESIATLTRRLRAVTAEWDDLAKRVSLAGGYHMRTAREVEIQAALDDTKPCDRDPADWAIAELLELVDAGRNRVHLEREAKEKAEAERDAAVAERDGLRAEVKQLQKRCEVLAAVADGKQATIDHLNKFSDEQAWVIDSWMQKVSNLTKLLAAARAEQDEANASEGLRKVELSGAMLNLAKAQTDLTTLRASLAAARADGEMLDWLEATALGKRADTQFLRSIFICHTPDGRLQLDIKLENVILADSLRAALTAAMKGEGNENTGRTQPRSR